MDASLIGVIIGGIIGVTGSVVGPLCLEFVRHRAERKNLTCALVGEISALITIVERRRYIPGLRSLIEVARTNPNLDTSYFYHFSVRRNPFPVYDANVSRIGLLESSLAMNIARFYSQASSILEDIADFRERRLPEGRDESVRRLEELLKLFEDTERLGREIVDDIT
jgi:hypothetical protein